MDGIGKDTGRVKEFAEILAPIAELLEQKNSDYGDSYARLRAEYGPVSFMLRVGDKINRLASLTVYNRVQKVSDEKIEDTIKDIIGYCTLELRFLQKERDKGTKADPPPTTSWPPSKFEAPPGYGGIDKDRGGPGL